MNLATGATMRRLFRSSLLAAFGLAFSAPAFAQAAPKLPAHIWVRLDGDARLATSQGWFGVTLPISRVTAIAVDVQASGTAAGVDVGPTFEAGALYLTPMAGVEFNYATGGLAFAGQLLAAFEAPPLPLYLETTVRDVTPFGPGANVLSDRTLILITLRKWLALGPEHDGSVAFGTPLGDSNRWGLRANFGLGKHAVFGVFAGYEFNATARVQEPLAGVAVRGTIDFTF